MLTIILFEGSDKIKKVLTMFNGGVTCFQVGLTFVSSNVDYLHEGLDHA